MDSVEVNSEAIYIGCKSINYAKKNMSDLLSLLSAKKINYSLIKNLGFEYQPILNDLGNQFGELEDYNTKLLKIKNVLLKADPNNEYLFQLIDLQFSQLDLGENPSEAEKMLILNQMKNIYHAAKKKNPSELTDYEKSIIQAYEEFGYDKFDTYQDLLIEIEQTKEECDRLSKNDKVGAGMGGYTIHSNDEYAQAESKLVNLMEQKKELEKFLKEKKLIELSAGDELKIAGKQFLDTIVDFKDNLLDGNFEEAFDDVKTIVATGAMVVEKVESGIYKIVENIGDGLVMLSASGAQMIYGPVDAIFGTNYAEESMDIAMDYIAIDQVGEFEKYRYENTEIGRFINDNSLLKYNSKGAEAIKDFGTWVGEKAFAIAIGTLTGGLAVPFVVGFLSGTGEAAEERFSQTDENGNYINREYDDIMYTYLKGFQKGAEWLSTASTGMSFTNNVKSLLTLKPSEVAKVFTEENLKRAFKDGVTRTFKSPSLYISLASIGAEGGAEYIAEGDIDIDEYIEKVTKTIIISYFGNVFGAAKENMSDQGQVIATKVQLADKVRGQATGAIKNANNVLNDDLAIPTSNFGDAAGYSNRVIGNTSDGLLGTNFGANVSINPTSSAIVAASVSSVMKESLYFALSSMANK